MAVPHRVSVRGRVDDVIDEFRIGPKRYYVLEKLGQRERFRVFDPSAGFQGDYRVVYFFSRSRDTEQQIEVLRRLAEKNLHLPKILECTRQADRIAVITTWIWGDNLRDYLTQVRERKHNRPSAREACRLMNKLAHGISYFHVKANIVHGDVKPANIVLEKDPARLVLIDFGSAWPAERAAKKTAGDGISVPYAAPEQLITGNVADFRADIFALTTVFFEMLTLDIPYEGLGGRAGLPENRLEFAGKCGRASDKISDAKSLPSAALTALDSFIQRGLALDASERFADRRTWLNSFDELLSLFRESSKLGFFEKWFLNLLDRWTAK